MNAMERRLKAIEQAEHARILARPPRDNYEAGLLRLERLPDAARRELETIIETAFDERGYLDHRRLTPAQRTRGSALLDKLSERTA